MIYRVTLLGFYFATFFITGCVPTHIEQRIKRLESSLKDIRSLQTEQMSQIADLQRVTRSLSGKTEELEYSASQKYGTDIEALKQDLTSLRRRVPPPANVPIQPLEEDEVSASRSNLGAFLEALYKIRSGNYTDALTELQLIKNSVPSEAVPHVLFWIGVTYDGLTEYKNALATYNQFIQNYPKHKRAPLTLIRLASVFEKLSDAQAGKIALQKLVNDYPNSPEAVAIKPKLESLVKSDSNSVKNIQNKKK